MSQFVLGGKAIFPSMESSLPYHKVKKSGAWWGKAYVKDTTFHDFESQKTFCGAKQYVIDLNSAAADYMPFYTLERVKFDNVGDDALAYFFDPPS